MTRRTRTSRSVENRLDELESEHAREGEERRYVISIGGDPDKPRGWVTPEEYEQHYGENSAADFSYTADRDDS